MSKAAKAKHPTPSVLTLSFVVDKNWLHEFFTTSETTMPPPTMTTKQQEQPPTGEAEMYEPFGIAWKNEMMKNSKAVLLSMIEPMTIENMESEPHSKMYLVELLKQQFKSKMRYH